VLHIHPIFADANPDIGGLYAARFDNETRNAYDNFKEFVDPATPDRLQKEVDDHWHLLGPDGHFKFVESSEAMKVLILPTGLKRLL
jgi:hypothetical protein